MIKLFTFFFEHTNERGNADYYLNNNLDYSANISRLQHRGGNFGNCNTACACEQCFYFVHNYNLIDLRQYYKKNGQHHTLTTKNPPNRTK